MLKTLMSNNISQKTNSPSSESAAGRPNLRPHSHPVKALQCRSLNRGVLENLERNTEA